MQNFDWRWIGVIAIIVLLTQIRFLPPYVSALLLAGGGGYFISIGAKAWLRGGGGGKKVTYWRGQRTETAPERRSFTIPHGRTLWQSVVYLLIGGVLVLGALSIFARYLS